MKKVRPHPFLYIFDEGMRSIIMAKRITMNTEKGKTYAEVFARFITVRTASGVSDITIRNYHNNLHAIGKYLDIDTPIEQLTKSQIDDMVVAMREAGLAHNSISTYLRIVRTFLNWCSNEGITSISIPNMKDRDTVKETYTDSELARLLKKPEKNCDFTEYRNWAIVNFLLNSGCRAAPSRYIPKVRRVTCKTLQRNMVCKVCTRTSSGTALQASPSPTERTLPVYRKSWVIRTRRSHCGCIPTPIRRA